MTLFTQPLLQFIGPDGLPYTFAKGYFFEADGTTPTTVYSDAACTTTLDQPVVADDEGRFVPIYYASGTSIRGRFYTSADILIGEALNLNSIEEVTDYYDIKFWQPSVPTNSQTLLVVNIVRPMTLPEDLDDGVFPSICTVGVAPTADTTLTLRKNGGSIGTLVFHTDQTVTTTITATSFVASDQLSITAQASADATAAAFALTLVFSLVHT